MLKIRIKKGDGEILIEIPLQERAAIGFDEVNSKAQTGTSVIRLIKESVDQLKALDS